MVVSRWYENEFCFFFKDILNTDLMAGLSCFEKLLTLFLKLNV